MDIVIELLTTLSAMSPLAVIALLGTIIFMMVKGKTAVDAKAETIASNHLHELPQIASDIRSMAESLQRIEVKMSEDFNYLKGRINGRH